ADQQQADGDVRAKAMDRRVATIARSGAHTAVTARSAQLCAALTCAPLPDRRGVRLVAVRAKDRALLAVERLKAVYPAISELDHKTPFQTPVATTLSSHTTHRSV